MLKAKTEIFNSNTLQLIYIQNKFLVYNDVWYVNTSTTTNLF